MQKIPEYIIEQTMKQLLSVGFKNGPGLRTIAIIGLREHLDALESYGATIIWPQKPTDS